MMYVGVCGFSKYSNDLKFGKGAVRTFTKSINHFWLKIFTDINLNSKISKKDDLKLTVASFLCENDIFN